LVADNPLVGQGIWWRRERVCDRDHAPLSKGCMEIYQMISQVGLAASPRTRAAKLRGPGIPPAGVSHFRLRWCLGRFRTNPSARRCNSRSVGDWIFAVRCRRDARLSTRWVKARDGHTISTATGSQKPLRQPWVRIPV
jgi:hypothetical protein